jgi:aminoglycoside phosphotransferase (APT) family kinase protein
VRVEDVLREALPGVDPVAARIVETGWDSRVLEVGDAWIVRIARSEWATEGYRIERRLLPRLESLLPVAVPVPERTGDGWILTRRIPGRPLDERAGAELGAQLAAFLQALHAYPVADARTLGVRQEQRAADVERFRSLVVPLLDRDERPSASRLLDEHLASPSPEVLTHADLGPEHVLVDAGGIAGVIDWTDARLGDPAVDLAWPLHGAPQQFAHAVADRFAVDAKLSRRAFLYHALGPWHEVVHGLRGEPGWIETGLAGVRERLTNAAGAAATMDK